MLDIIYNFMHGLPALWIFLILVAVVLLIIKFFEWLREVVG